MAHKNKNVIIYARYSSELQNDRSIEDQVAACKQALLLDEQVTHVFEDRAKSGAFMIGRPGIHSLLAEVKRGSCAIIVTEALDRLSRSLEDVAHIYRLASFYGVRIRTLLEDEVTEMHICFNGAMASMQLQQTIERTRRGQIGNIHTGKAGGGLAYGYRVKHLNDAGELEPGLREIEPAQAEIVRSIYADYAAEVPVLQIVKRLNTAGIPSPRGGKWSAVTITGHYARGDGLLQNALYRGLLVWGRCPEVKHPVTAKRQIRIEDKDKWVTQHVPDLRIVEDDLWFWVQALREAKHQTHQKRQSFSKFALPCYCASCDAKMVRADQRYLICGTSKRYQTCLNNKRYATTQIFEALCNHLTEQSEILWPGWIEGLSLAYRESGDQTKHLRQQLEEKELQNRRLIDALASGLAGSQSINDRILRNEQEIEALQQQLLALTQLPVPDSIQENRFHPALLEAIKAGQEVQFLLDHIKAVTLGRDDDNKLVIASIQPDFVALAELLDSPKQSPVGI